MMPDDAMTSATRIVGRSVPRMDAPGKVTGTALYAADFALPGMLYGKVLRSSEPHARLVRIDAGRAARLPGVRAVITAADVPLPRTLMTSNSSRYCWPTMRPTMF